MTKNLHYFIVLIVALSALYSNTRAVFLAIKDKPVYYHLKNMNAVLVVNGFCSICSFNIMFHYLFNPMVINKRNYILSICSVFLAIICFFLYRIINKNRKKQYLEAFTMSDRYLAVNRIYEFIKEKCNDGKEFKEVTTFELNFYLVGSLLETIETNFSSLYLDKSFLITDIYDALITMKLDNLGEIFKEANDKLFKDGYFDENDELLEFYQKRLKENEDQIYEIMHEYMVRNRSFFVYF